MVSGTPPRHQEFRNVLHALWHLLYTVHYYKVIHEFKILGLIIHEQPFIYFFIKTNLKSDASAMKLLRHWLQASKPFLLRPCKGPISLGVSLFKNNSVQHVVFFYLPIRSNIELLSFHNRQQMIASIPFFLRKVHPHLLAEYEVAHRLVAGEHTDGASP